jgi:hypothetical protein
VVPSAPACLEGVVFNIFGVPNLERDQGRGGLSRMAQLDRCLFSTTAR